MSTIMSHIVPIIVNVVIVITIIVLVILSASTTGPDHTTTVAQIA